MKIIRKLKTWEITNKKLYDGLIEKKIRISELAKIIGITPRAIEAWIFENANPRYNYRKRKVNQILEKEIYDI